MKFRFLLPLVLEVALALALTLALDESAVAQEARLDSLRQVHAQAAQLVSTLAADREVAATWAEDQYRLIPEARERDTNTLRAALAAAQFAADSLAVLDATFAEAQTVEREARAALASELEDELERTLREAERADPEDKVALTERAQALDTELTQVQQRLELPATELPAAVALAPGDGPEEIALKADFLSDRATQLRNAADVVASEMSKAERRGELHEEMRRLVDEVRLFDEAGLPPSVTQSGEAAPENIPTFGDLDTRTGIGDVGITATGERALDLPILPVEGELQPRDGETVMDQMERLRQNLLQRAEALERQAQEFRELLQRPPP
jgi:hypothetical protein